MRNGFSSRLSAIVLAIAAVTPVVVAAQTSDRAFMMAVGLQNEDEVRTMIAHGADVNLTDEHGDHPLTIASRGGNIRIVQALIRAGADLNAKGQGGQAPLYAATFANYSNIVALLLASGA